MYEKINNHFGCNIEVARYGRDCGRTENVTVECTDCNEVLVDAYNPDWDKWNDEYVDKTEKVNNDTM